MHKYSEHIPVVLLALFTGKLLITQNWSMENAVVLLGLVAVTSIFQLKAKYDQYQDLKNEFKKQKEELELLSKKIEATQSSMMSMKLAAQTKAIKF